MKKKILSTIICTLLTMPLTTFADLPFESDQIIEIDLICQKIDSSKINPEFHRTPVQIPNVYLNQESNTLYFENPCYECTLELVIPGTDTSVYTVVIPDGDNVVQLPTDLVGQYELHIHRGNYCFWGLIVL